MNPNPSRTSSHYRFSIAAAMVYAVFAFLGMRTSATANETPELAEVTVQRAQSATLDAVIVSARRLQTVIDPVVVTAPRQHATKLILAPVFVFIADEPNDLFASNAAPSGRFHGSSARTGLLARVRGWFGSAFL